MAHADVILGGRRSIIMAKIRNALNILERVTGTGQAARDEIAEARVKLDVAQMIYDARARAGLSQRELAALIGSSQPVIARLEDADYEGHSLTMVRRIAAALDQRLQMQFIPNKPRREPTPSRRSQPA